MQKIQVQSLGREDPLEWEVATHFSILAWKVSWTEEPSGAGPSGHRELDTTEQLRTHTYAIALLTTPAEMTMS